MGKNRSKNRA